MNKTSSHVILGLTILILFATLIILNIYTPLLVDDYWLQFKLSLSLKKCTDEPIESFLDLFSNMWNHRYIYNGRLANNIVMFLLYTVGKGGFNILNSLVIILSLCAVCKITLVKVTYRNLLASCAFAIFVIPCIPQTVFWLAGSCNYLWVVPFICGVLFYLEKYFNNQRLSSLQTAILLSCSLIASSMHEASGVILCGMLLLSVIYQYRKKEPMKLLWWVLLVSIIGTSIPLSSPAIWHRATISNGEVPNIFIHFFYSIQPLISYCWLPILLLLVCLYKQRLHSLLSPKGFYVLSGFVCTFIFAVYSQSGRGCFYLNLSILIFILQRVRNFSNYKQNILLYLPTLTIIVATVLQLDEFTKFRYVVEEENKRAQEEKIFSIEIPSSDYKEMYFKHGTSWLGSAVSQKQYSIIQGVPEHLVILNTLDFDKKIYCKFPVDHIDQPFVIKTKNICIIRLPKGNRLEKDSFTINTCGKNADLPTCFLYRKHNLWNEITVKIKPHRTLSLYSTDYQNGFFYIILPEPACHYHELTCSVTLPDESTQELHIDLDESYIN